MLSLSKYEGRSRTAPFIGWLVLRPRVGVQVSAAVPCAFRRRRSSALRSRWFWPGTRPKDPCGAPANFRTAAPLHGLVPVFSRPRRSGRTALACIADPMLEA